MSLEPLCVKTEAEEVYVKEDAECENKEPRAHDYKETGAHVKEETGAHVKEETGAHVKEEVQSEDRAELCELYTDHQVKDELALGPVELHRPCVPSAPVAPNKDEARGQACLARLERSTQLGLHTFTLTDMDVFYHCQFSRMYVYELWKPAPGLPTEKTRQVQQLLLQTVPAENVDNENLCNRVAYLCKKLTEYWKKVSRTHRYMVDRYCDWLNVIETVNLPKKTASSSSRAALGQEECNSNTSKRRRPRKYFKECSKRPKSRRLVELSQIDDCAVSSLVDTSNNNVKCEVNVDEVLSLIMEAKLTKHQYLLIKEFVNSKTNPVLPSYHKIMDAKELSPG